MSNQGKRRSNKKTHQLWLRRLDDRSKDARLVAQVGPDNDGCSVGMRYANKSILTVATLATSTPGSQVFRLLAAADTITSVKRCCRETGRGRRSLVTTVVE